MGEFNLCHMTCREILTYIKDLFIEEFTLTTA